MDTIKIIKMEEDLFPKTFTGYIEKDYGFLFYNDDNKTSHDSNHALIYKNRIIDLEEVLDDITEFYKSREINPRIYQSMDNDGYFQKNINLFQKHGYKVWAEGPYKFMILSGKNMIKEYNRLDIKLLDKWDNRIAVDICIPSDEEHEIEILKDSCEKKDYHVFVGYLNNTAIVVVYFHIAKECCRFDYILVSEKFRKNGYGREILSFVTDFCRKNNIKNCFQWPAHETSERICYEAGFREISTVIMGRAEYIG